MSNQIDSVSSTKHEKMNDEKRRRHAELLILVLCLPLLLLTSCGARGQNESAARGESVNLSGQADKKETAAAETDSKDSGKDDKAEVGAAEPDYMAEVALTGGSGRASVESPCIIFERDGVLYAQIKWSSPNYDYMIVDGQQLTPVNKEGNSVFEVPLPKGIEEALSAEDAENVRFIMQVQADTTAMGTPHLIEYELEFSLLEAGGGASTELPAENDGANADESPDGKEDNSAALAPPVIDGLTYESTDANDYAECFALHRYKEGYTVLSVNDGRNYLFPTLAEDGNAQAGANGQSADSGQPADSGQILKSAAEAGLIVIANSPQRIYLAATAVMSQLDAIGAVTNVALSGIKADAWYIDAAREAMRDGKILYGGKYSAPDYEKMIEMGIDLAIESSMILHAPRVEEKITQLGIPVLIDRSSYEPEPLGRAEWVKVYGALTGHEQEAQAAFDEQEEAVRNLFTDSGQDSAGVGQDSAGSGTESAGTSAAIFSINSTRQITTRKPGDYFARMVEQAGGTFLTPGASAPQETGTQTVSMEAFFDAASEADVLIYNTAIEDAPTSVEELVRQYPLLKECRAYRDDRIWCTKGSLYQNAGSAGWIIRDLHCILTESGEPAFFVKLE